MIIINEIKTYRFNLLHNNKNKLLSQVSYLYYILYLSNLSMKMNYISLDSKLNIYMPSW